MIIIIDLDGVIWRGNELIDPSVPSVIEGLQKDGHRISYLTNNSTRTRIGFVYKFRRLGITAKKQQIMTSGYSAVLYLEKLAKTAKKKYTVMIIGAAAVARELKKTSFKAVNWKYGGDVDFVVVGMDKKFNYLKLAAAQNAIIKGASFIGTNPDKTFPLEGGRIGPGNGSILAAIEAATGEKPYIIGKPNPFMIKQIIRSSGTNKDVVCLVGDRLDTDILSGKRAGIKTILALSGISTLKMVRKTNENQKPDLIIKDIRELPRAIKRI